MPAPAKAPQPATAKAKGPELITDKSSVCEPADSPSRGAGSMPAPTKGPGIPLPSDSWQWWAVDSWQGQALSNITVQGDVFKALIMLTSREQDLQSFCSA